MTISSPTAAPARRRPWRWLTAAVATAALVVSGSGLVVFAQSGAGESRGPQFVPADAPVYIEARLDMPDGQSEALAQFLTAFPGFADAGAFQMKLDQALDGLFGQVMQGSVDYSAMSDAVTGEVGVAVTDLSDISTSSASGEVDVLIGVAVSDAAAAATFVEQLIASSSASGTTSQETYGDTAILTDASTAIAVHDDWILLAPNADLVKSGIDVLEGTSPSLASDADFTAAFSRLPAGRLGAAYLDLQSFAGIIDTTGLQAFGQSVPATGDIAALLPKDFVAYLAAEDDRLTLEAFITPGEAPLALPVGESDAATRFPADTQLYVEVRDLGPTLQSSLEAVFASMGEEASAQLAPIESMLGESLPTFLDFIGDAGVGAALSSDGLWVGIAAEVTDAEVAATRVERILSVVRLFTAGAQDSGIGVEETTIGDQAVTVITLPISQMAGQSMPLPISDTISIALAGDTLLIGLGDFVETALTQTSADSLAESAGYLDALAGDTPNSGVIYGNVSSLLTQLDPMLSALVPQWADISPYATAVDALIVVATAEDGVISTRISVIANQ